MSVFTTAAILVTLAALFSYINYRFLKIPTTIGIMLISLVMSLGLIALHMLGWSNLEEQAERMVRGIDFHEALMEGMLSFLLFAGALHINLNDLKEQKWVILSLATFGVLISTFLIGVMSWLILNQLGISLPFIY
ncbi:MAG: cation:proton antiporter, partial [Gammaproteobacteria bacterium]